MTNTIEFSSSCIAGLLIAGLLCCIIPIGAVIIYKLKNREVSLLSALWGALGFFVFALVLEQILHLVMLPVVMDTVWPYAFYGAFAAGIFEETARFLVFKTVMKKKTSPKEGIMYGIGHGGFEAIAIMGTTMLSYALLAIISNSLGFEQMLAMTSATDEATIEIATQQMTAVAQQTIGVSMLSVLERLIAMTIHISLSVWVFRAANEKKYVWLYPAAIVMHATVDFPVALFQKGMLSTSVMYILFSAFTVVAALIAVRIYKSMKKKNA